MKWSALASPLLLAPMLLVPPVAAIAQSAAAPALTPQQAQQALDVLRDPERRAAFIAVLDALAADRAFIAAAALGWIEPTAAAGALGDHWASAFMRSTTP